MLAQGAGITPLRSMLTHVALTAMAIDSSLIHVADAGHPYRDETQQRATTAEGPPGVRIRRPSGHTRRAGRRAQSQ